MNPYIGVTGFASPEEVYHLLRDIPRGKRRKVMIGVLAGPETFNPISTDSRLYPSSHDIRHIFSADDRALNAIHFGSRSKEGLFEEIDGVLRLAGPHCQALQVNLPWPEPSLLERLKQDRPQLEIIVSIGEKAVQLAGGDSHGVVERLHQYRVGLVDRVLVDFSWGKGIPLDPDRAEVYLAAVKVAFPRIGLGVAGGLSAENLDRIAGLSLEFSDLSIDAQGKLLDDSGKLNLLKAEAYLMKGFNYLGFGATGY
ncbi:MAG: hypothetical protein KGZ30_03200 [Anaplasmataceae bacterium]|nr:hypothetical protein [Anaplasmataceae bacterium]